LLDLLICVTSVLDKKQLKMKLSQDILAEITQVTRDIKDNFPELQKYLDENPMTLPLGDTANVEVDNEAFREYLNSLKELVSKYQKEH
jgi:hypothetical protein